MRILPHHQDTGGFFVAVLEKVKPLPWENEVDIKLDIKSDTKPEYMLNQNVQNLSDNKDELIPKEETSQNELSENGKRILEEEKKSRDLQRKRRRIVGYREDPFVFFKDETEDVWQSIK